MGRLVSWRNSTTRENPIGVTNDISPFPWIFPRQFRPDSLKYGGVRGHESHARYHDGQQWCCDIRGGIAWRVMEK